MAAGEVRLYRRNVIRVGNVVLSVASVVGMIIMAAQAAGPASLRDEHVMGNIQGVVLHHEVLVTGSAKVRSYHRAATPMLRVAAGALRCVEGSQSRCEAGLEKPVHRMRIGFTDVAGETFDISRRTKAEGCGRRAPSEKICHVGLELLPSRAFSRVVASEAFHVRMAARHNSWIEHVVVNRRDQDQEHDRCSDRETGRDDRCFAGKHGKLGALGQWATGKYPDSIYCYYISLP